jgi:hypothetical protein
LPVIVVATVSDSCAVVEAWLAELLETGTALPPIPNHHDG